MKSNGIKIGIVAVVVLAAGYALGAFVGWPNSQDKLLSGNVGKADRYKKEVASPELKAFEEKLKSDEQFRSQTVFSLAFINSRTSEFKENAEMAAEATSTISDLSKMNSEMQSLSQFAANAEKASGDAMEALNNIMKGESEVNYEELSNNAIISYMLLDKGLTLAQEYVVSADEFLSGKKMEDYRYLAYTRDQWAAYSAMDAYMNKNKEMMAYWQEKDLILDPETNQTLVASLNPGRQAQMQSRPILFNLDMNALVKLDNADQLGNVGKLRMGDVLSICQLLDNEKLGIFNAEKLGIFNAEKLGIFNAEKLGIFNAEKLGIFNAEKLGIFNAEKLGMVNNVVSLGLASRESIIQNASVLGMFSN